MLNDVLNYIAIISVSGKLQVVLLRNNLKFL